MINVPSDSERLSSGEVYTESVPFYRKEEQLTQQALQIATIPGEWLQQNIRPNLPQVQLFPPRFGYMSYQDRQFSCADVLSFPGAYANRQYDTSGGPAEINASARNVSESNSGW